MADWELRILRPARRYLERLAREDQERLLGALEQLQKAPARANAKPLHGRPEWSLRVGEKRVLFRADRERQLIVVTSIASRGDAYK